MSYFTVLVIGDKPGDQLERFQVNDGCLPKEYLQFQIIIPANQILEKAEDILENSRLEEHIIEEILSSCMSIKGKHQLLCAIYYGGELDEVGNIGSLQNLNARWDTMDTSELGYFKLRKNEQDTKECDVKVDQAFKRDIDLQCLQPTFAILENGNWSNQDNEEFWIGTDMDGMSCTWEIYDQDEMEKRKKEWESSFMNRIKKLPDDTWLSVYKCSM